VKLIIGLIYIPMTLYFLDMLTPTEVEQLRNSGKGGLTHPVARLALAKGSNQVGTNTQAAARRLLRTDPAWLSGLKQRLMDTTDFSNASSALGEIRAYGALLETSMTVRPHPVVAGKNVVPEFEVEAEDGAAIVEVHSRQLDHAQVRAIAQKYKALEAKVKAKRAATPRKGTVTTSVVEVIPFGAPDPTKSGDSVLTNVISRVCSIKSNEKQSNSEKPFVLWLDLQDPTVWPLPISDEQLAPLYTEIRDGAVGTGGLWFALYGRENDPMIEMRSCDYREIPMLHDGRFALTKRVSAVVYSLPATTVLMEHPSPTCPIPPRFRASLLKLPFFALDRSVCEWKPGIVTSYLDFQRNMVSAAAKALVAFNPT
jgi:hypothetical protein